MRRPQNAGRHGGRQRPRPEPTVVDGIATRGQPAAVAAIRRMIEGGAPHALLVSGPPAVGKTTLALDLAAGLLCLAGDPAARPCRVCRGCRLVASGNHPDLHRIVPEGPGLQVRIDAIRELVSDLALLPVEGGARVAIIEAAHRLNEDAQNALLKTLEEPPGGVVIVLCTDDEDLLLPTIRSRCARIHLGTVSGREIETWLAERGIADPPMAARLARLADGRPGLALAYAVSVEAVAARTEIDRTLIDLLDTGIANRLTRARGLLTVGRVLADALDRRGGEPAEPTRRLPARGRRRAAATTPAAAVRPVTAAVTPPATAGDRSDATDAPPTADPAEPAAKVTPAERRRAAAQLIDVWRDLAVDLSRASLGDARRLHDPGLLEEIRAAAAAVPQGSLGPFLGRLARIGEAVDGNANPELAIDVLALAWPRSSSAPRSGSSMRSGSAG